MTRNLGIRRTTLRLIRDARKNCAKVIVLEPRQTAPTKRIASAKILPFTKSRAGG